MLQGLTVCRRCCARHDRKRALFRDAGWNLCLRSDALDDHRTGTTLCLVRLNPVPQRTAEQKALADIRLFPLGPLRHPYASTASVRQRHWRRRRHDGQARWGSVKVSRLTPSDGAVLRARIRSARSRGRLINVATPSDKIRGVSAFGKAACMIPIGAIIVGPPSAAIIKTLIAVFHFANRCLVGDQHV